jgi:hypothetical protein
MNVLLFVAAHTTSGFPPSSGPCVAPTVVTYGHDAGHCGLYAQRPTDERALGPNRRRKGREGKERKRREEKRGEEKEKEEGGVSVC